METKRLLIADDHDLVRETIAVYLRQQGGYEVLVASSFEEALDKAQSAQRIDLVLLDFSMPGMDALGGLTRMRDVLACPVAIISGTAPPDVARRALRAGAAGFLPKTLDPMSLMAAVRQMLLGETFSPTEFLSKAEPTAHRVVLTPREQEVIRGVADGKSNKEIARDLSIREVTVKLHVKTLSRKLGARNRTHAAMLGRDMGLT